MAQPSAYENVPEFSEEIREASPANFLIKIESFSLLKKNGIDKYESRAFKAGGHKWKLIIYPEGNKNSENEEDSHLSAYLTIVETGSLPEGWEVNAIFTFFVHNQLLDNYLCFRGMTRRFNGLNNKWGISKVMTKEALMDSSMGFLVEDSCVFGAEVYVLKNERVNERLRLVEAAYPYKRDWKISNLSKVEDEIWKSEVFEVEGYNWKVWVHPNGSGSHVKDRYISILVESIDSKIFAPHEKIKAQVSLRIKSKLDEADHTHTYSKWFTSSSRLGYYEFFPNDDMRSKGFLIDDCCFLQVEIAIQALART